MVDELRNAGAEVEVLPIAAAAGRLGRDRVTPGRIPFGASLGGLTYATRLARRLRELDPDIVHTNTLKAAVYGGVAGRAAGVTVVWHIRDRIADDYLPASTAAGVAPARPDPPRRGGRQLARDARNARATSPSPSYAVPSPVIHDAATPRDGGAPAGRRRP